MTEFLPIWLKRTLGLKDELIRFWWSEVKRQGHCDLTTARFMLVNAISQERLEGIEAPFFA